MVSEAYVKNVLGECLEMCTLSTGMPIWECGMQCTRSVILDAVDRRGMPNYVPFDARQLPPQFTEGRGAAASEKSLMASRKCTPASLTARSDGPFTV